MDVAQALKRLEELFPSEDQIATAIGLEREDLRRTLADRFDPLRTEPPPGWKLALAHLIRERADQLRLFASGLEATEERRAL